MRLEYPHRTERFGAVRIRNLQRVIEIDSGPDRGDDLASDLAAVQCVPTSRIREIEADLVVVVPCKNETRKVIEGVLSGIPHDCLIVLVSNSDRVPVDQYAEEVEVLEQFCRVSQRPALSVHQRDPGLAAAVKAAGMPELVGDDGLVHNGKGEAMLVGTALAALSGRRYIGYVDADNYVPGAVTEYCKAYAAGLHLAGGPFSMVRICWGSKPKLRDGRMFFSRWGRSSEVVNQFLNRLIGEYSGFGTDVIATGNSGEHALTMDLAVRLRTASGFAVEPYHFIDLFEQFGGLLDTPHADVLGSSVNVVQIESRNPHFHDDKGAEHVQGMRTQALNALYHSPICPPSVRDAIQEFLEAEGAIEPGTRPPTERIYPPVATMALDIFYDALVAEASSFRQMQRREIVGVRGDAPIRRPALLGDSAPAGCGELLSSQADASVDA
ncbi:MAG: mannosyl-3-phosphoglycerate synthase [Micromonosporaceae bacterium]|nr:mannosyl-3-phosphoglycerate synthase [Micromonosporaceae bacterium]